MSYVAVLASRLGSRSPSLHTLDKDDRASIASSQGTRLSRQPRLACVMLTLPVRFRDKSLLFVRDLFIE